MVWLLGLFLLFVAIAAVIGYLGYQAAKRRREQFAAIAHRHGWTYAARDDRWVEAFDGAPFGRGRDCRAENVLTGQYDGRPLAAFDYRYSTTETSTLNGSTNTHTEVHPYSVVAIDMGAQFPVLAISPEGLFDRVLDLVTGSDIDFESEDFNRMFRVTCPDRKFASDVVHPQMMQLLMRHPSFACRFDGSHVLAITAGNHTEADLEAKLRMLDAVVDQIPDFVWTDTIGSVPPAQPSRQVPPAEGATS